jgi:hypothetical protein
MRIIRNPYVKCGALLIAKTGGTYSYRSALMCKCLGYYITYKYNETTLTENL